MAKHNNSNETKLTAFPPIVSHGARVLILGSMPSASSLAAGQYYAHPRNHFWTILNTLFDINMELSYDEYCRRLTAQYIAVWDVIASCERNGSLDSSIIETSILVNDFRAFFEQYNTIHSVFFNGTKAEQIYRQYVLPTLPSSIELSYTRLPSSSPANATWSLAKKLKAWEAIKLSCLIQAPVK